MLDQICDQPHRGLPIASIKIGMDINRDHHSIRIRNGCLGNHHVLIPFEGQLPYRRLRVEDSVEILRRALLSEVLLAQLSIRYFAEAFLNPAS